MFASADAIIHAGAAVPSARSSYGENELFDANVRAVFNLAGWARKRQLPFVHISGAIVYANPNGPDIREDAPLGWSGLGGSYGLTKLLAEDVLRREEGRGLALAILRPSSIYGYGLAAEKIICSFLNRAREGAAIELSEPVDDGADLIHAADVASAVVKVLKREAWETFNLGAGKCTSVRDLAATCISVAGEGTIEITDGDGPPRPPERRFGLNCQLANERLGWSARIGLPEGLRAVLEHEVLVVHTA